MACICHRMCSRRGGCHGKGICPPTTPSPDSASPSPSLDIPNPYGSFSGQYPDTRSGRERAQLQGASWRDTTVHTTNFSLPPHPAPHTTQFRFHNTLNRPIITATVTITFSDENDPQEAPPENNVEQQKTAQRNQSSRDPVKQLLDEDVTSSHGKELGGSQQAIEGRAGDTWTPRGKVVDTFDPHAATGSSVGIQTTRGLQTGTSIEEEDWYQYACLIEEEPIPDDL